MIKEINALESISYAGFWLRFMANFIDFLIKWGALTFFFIILKIFITPLVDTTESVLAVFVIYIFFGIVVDWLYDALQYSSRAQATLGMRVFSIKVIDYQYQRISFARGTGRHFAKILSALPLYLGFLVIAFTKKKQGFHDMLARTYMIRD